MSNYEVSKSSISLITKFPNEYRNKVLKLALASYLPTIQDRSKVINNLSRDAKVSKEVLFEVLGIYISLIGLFLHSSDNEYNQKLVEMGFDSEFIEELPFLGNREEIIDNLRKTNRSQFARLSSFKWKIDISLSQSALAKKVPNFVLFSFRKKDGTKYIIELDPRTFHKLRYNIALILNELNNLKANK